MWFKDQLELHKMKVELDEVRKERDSLKSFVAQTEGRSLYEISQAIAKLKAQWVDGSRQVEERKVLVQRQIQELDASVAKRKEAIDQELSTVSRELDERKKELIILDEELLLQSFGFYTLRYDLQNSELYRIRIDEIRDRQSAMIKSGTAATCPETFLLNDSSKEGKRMVKDFTKLVVRSFNNECDASIANVKFNNIGSIERKIRKAFETLNRLTTTMRIAILPEYLNLKLEEMYLCHEYQMKKQEEKEEQKRIREQMREEAKLVREIEEFRLKVEKEETHFNNAKRALEKQIQEASTDVERRLLEEERGRIEVKLADIETSKKDIDYREQNTRAGYVYVISNIGAFGEGVYKIGVTRRLNPEERVYELGDASVPFNFDTHAMIFSDDAPSLENALHNEFTKGRLNMINRRKEFFYASLDEIERVVRQNFNKPVEFIRTADAAQYRESLNLRKADAP